MLKVIAHNFIKEEFIETVRPYYEELIELTRKEPNCISYELFEDQKEVGLFIFIETWPNQEALDEHCESEHFKRLVPLIGKYQGREGGVFLMDPFINNK